MENYVFTEAIKTKAKTTKRLKSTKEETNDLDERLYEWYDKYYNREGKTVTGALLETQASVVIGDVRPQKRKPYAPKI